MEHIYFGSHEKFYCLIFAMYLRTTLLYINDQPLVSQFDTTLFADDTYLYLTLSDKSLSGLELKANNELRKIGT